MARVSNLLRFRAGIGIACLLATATCAPGVDARRAAFDEATVALRQGRLLAASTTIEQYAQGAASDELWGWRFRLLQAEIALARLDRTAADSLLAPDRLPG
jgi:hypothetical protein